MTLGITVWTIEFHSDFLDSLMPIPLTVSLTISLSLIEFSFSILLPPSSDTATFCKISVSMKTSLMDYVWSKSKYFELNIVLD